MKSVCKGCGAEIRWIQLKSTGRKMPVDPEPVWVLPGVGRNTFIREDGGTVIGSRIGDAWDDDPDANTVQAYESHYASCPVGGQFRTRALRTRAPGYR